MYAHGWVLGAKAKLEWLPGGKAGRQAPLVPKRQAGRPWSKRVCALDIAHPG